MDAGWIAIAVIVGLGIILSFVLQVVRMGIDHENRKIAAKAGEESAPAEVARLEQILAATQAEMAKLRDRVQVLERLATDDDRRLAGEIDRLRSAEDARR